MPLSVIQDFSVFGCKNPSSTVGLNVICSPYQNVQLNFKGIIHAKLELIAAGKKLNIKGENEKGKSKRGKGKGENGNKPGGKSLKNVSVFGFVR